MSTQIEKVREQMFDLIGHISFGDYSDLDTYWRSLADALLALKFQGGIILKPVGQDGPTSPNGGGEKKLPSTFDVLVQIEEALQVEIATLTQICEEMEYLSSGGSYDVINAKNAEKLEQLAGEFEGAFERFLDETLSPFVENED